LAFFSSKYCLFLQKVNDNIGFWENANFFCRKLAKVVENCDYNIDSKYPKCFLWPSRNIPMSSFKMLSKTNSMRQNLTHLTHLTHRFLVILQPSIVLTSSFFLWIT
jgi:hypothetical protein